MQIRKILISFLAIGFAPIAFADYPQDITVCTNVIGNDTPYRFEASFFSSDIFDISHSTGYVITPDRRCTSHHYDHGPKNITMSVGNNLYRGFTSDFTHLPVQDNDMLIIPDSSCSFMQRTSEHTFSFDKTRIRPKRVSYDFQFKQIPPNDGYRYSFNMLCRYSASN